MSTIKISFFAISILLFTCGISYAQGGAVFIEDQDSFEGTCTGLALEDFEDTNLGPDVRAFCPGPINSLTDNECYSPGAIIPGFSLDSISLTDVIVTTPPRSGFTNVAVSANLNSDAVITFSDAVNAVGMSLVAGRSSEAVAEVNVYGAGNTLLGTKTLNLISVFDTFLGVIANEQIERIEIIDITGRGVPSLYDLSFGPCDNARPIPTLSEWGLIAMAGVLGIVGLLALRKRKAVNL